MNLNFKFLLIASILYSCHPALNNHLKHYRSHEAVLLSNSTNNDDSDSCSNPFPGSCSEFLAAFMKSDKDCERGYFQRDTSGYYLKKIVQKDISRQFAFIFFERDSLSMIFTVENGKWIPYCSLTGYYSYFNSGTCNCNSEDLAVPEVRLVDFNGDHIDDIQIINTVNVNGNEYSTLCITDTINKTLFIPKYVFSNPEYNPRTQKLEEVEWAGVTRNEFHATYLWKGLELYPDFMLEDDKSEIDWDKSPASGLRFNVYQGNGASINESANWKLIKSYRDPSEKVYKKWFREAGIEW